MNDIVPFNDLHVSLGGISYPLYDIYICPYTYTAHEYNQVVNMDS